MLRIISGNTGYIAGAVNIGVYKHEQGECSIIDTGLDTSAAKLVLKTLRQEGLRLKRIIITHSHADHTGGAARILKDMPAEICATSWEAAIIENPLLEPFYLYSAYPVAELQSKFFLAAACQGVKVIEPGAILDGLRIIDLAGHSESQIGVFTPDNVCFVADAFFANSVLEKYYIPYFANICKTKGTLIHLNDETASCFLPSHGEPMQDIRPTVWSNLDRLKGIEEDIIRFLQDKAYTKEEIVARFAEEKAIDLNMGQYHLVAATIAAFLSYLKEERKIIPHFTNGLLKWTCDI